MEQTPVKEQEALHSGAQAGEIRAESRTSGRMKDFSRKWKRRKTLLLFVLPAVILALIFNYMPMVGVLIAFKDNINFIRYSNPLEAFMNATWTVEHFQKIFSDPEILKYIGNTLIISVLKIVILFPLPVVLAIMITEVSSKWFSKLTQMAVFLPHFLSWVVIVGIFKSVLAIDGPVNQVLISMGLMDANSPTYWFGTDSLFRDWWCFCPAGKRSGTVPLSTSLRSWRSIPTCMRQQSWTARENSVRSGVLRFPASCPPSLSCSLSVSDI